MNEVNGKMTNEELNTALYQKMFAEQETYRKWLLTQPPEEILKHTYEYTVREDILMTLENNDLEDAQAAVLLKSPSPLDDVYKEFENRETDYMDTVLDSVTERAKTVLQREKSLKEPKESVRSKLQQTPAARTEPKPTVGKKREAER